jgi:hypothetical protein
MPNDNRTDMQVVYLCNDDGTIPGLCPAGLCHYCKELFYWSSAHDAVYHRPQNIEGEADCPNRGKWFKIGPMVEFVVEPAYAPPKGAYVKPEAIGHAPAWPNEDEQQELPGGAY